MYQISQPEAETHAARAYPQWAREMTVKCRAQCTHLISEQYKRAARYRRALTGVAGAKDILVWTPDEVAQWRDVPNAFVTAAVQEGVVLFERSL